MSVQYGTNFEILDITDQEDFERLRDLLTPREHRQDDSLSIPATRLVHLLRPKCKAVVVEKNYIDPDFRAGYGRFHYLRHQDTPRRCDRLHFFACSITEDDLLEMSNKVKQAYIGFSVIRPLPGFRLGRSILCNRLQPQNHEDVYITCTAKHRANLAGNEIEFTGVPWMEQDTLVSRCASAALWIACCHSAHKFTPEYKEFCTPIITDLATRYDVSTGRAMPGNGLTPGQMIFALNEMGYEPVPYVPKSAVEALRIAYRYVESEIPVIILIEFQQGGHAVTAIGHGFNPQVEPEMNHISLDENRSLPICRTSDFATCLVIQDDSGGAFRRLEFIDWEEAADNDWIDREGAETLTNIEGCAVVLDRGENTQEVAFLISLIVPLPAGVTLDGYGAEARAVGLLSTWYSESDLDISGNTVIRTYLQSSNDFKSRFTRLDDECSVLSCEIRRHLMSKWIWVTEIAQLEDFRESKVANGFIIQDCASHATEWDYFDIIAWLLPGSALVTVQPDNTYSTFPLPGDVKFPILSREI